MRRSLLNAEYAAFPDHDAIFRLGELQRQPETIHIAHVNRSFAAPSTVSSEQVKVAMKQRAQVVRDLERLIVKDRLHIRQLVPPQIKHCDKHNKSYSEDPHVSNACIPISTGSDDEYWLLFGADATGASSEASDTEAEEVGSYEKTPLARIYELCRKYVDQEFEDDDAANGGALRALASKVACDVRSAVDLVIARLAGGRAKGKAELRLVYQVCSEQTSFEALGWILDAARKPLEALPPQAFEAKYALPRYLAFKQREARAAEDKDYYGCIYGSKRGCR